MNNIEFTVFGRWTFRGVACRVAMCVGNTDRLARNDGEDGYPFWDGERFDVRGNDWWLRKLREDGDATVYRLDYRYGFTPERQAAMAALKTWLESDMVFEK